MRNVLVNKLILEINDKFPRYCDEVFIQMDNASSHKTYKVKMKLNELGIEPVYSVPQQPDLNPTESCFSKIKNYYKRRKLNMLMNEEHIDFV